MLLSLLIYVNKSLILMAANKETYHCSISTHFRDLELIGLYLIVKLPWFNPLSLSGASMHCFNLWQMWDNNIFSVLIRREE